MYATGNPKTKAELRARVEAARLSATDPTAPRVSYPTIFSPGPFPAPLNGASTIEGPQFPAPHRWYAVVELEDGKIVKVSK